MAETKLCLDSDTLIGMCQRFAHEVFARHPQIDAAITEFARNFRSGEEEDIKIVLAFDARTIIAVVIRQNHLVTGLFQHGERLFLQPPFGRQCQCDAHCFSPASA